GRAAHRRRDRARARHAHPRDHRGRRDRDGEAAPRERDHRRSEQAGRQLHHQSGEPLMPSGSLARRYAKAVLALGTDQGNLDRVGGDLRAISKAFKDSAELATVLSNPAIRRADRKRVIDAVLEKLIVQPSTKNLVYLLLDGERLDTLP